MRLRNDHFDGKKEKRKYKKTVLHPKSDDFLYLANTRKVLLQNEKIQR